MPVAPTRSFVVIHAQPDHQASFPDSRFKIERGRRAVNRIRFEDDEHLNVPAVQIGSEIRQILGFGYKRFEQLHCCAHIAQRRVDGVRRQMHAFRLKIAWNH